MSEIPNSTTENPITQRNSIASYNKELCTFFQEDRKVMFSMKLCQRVCHNTNDFNHRDPSKTILWHGGIHVLTSVFIIIIIIIIMGVRIKKNAENFTDQTDTFNC